MPEGRRIFAELSVEENLRLGIAGRRERDGVDDDLAAIYELFPIVAEFRRRHAGALSGGQQQQLAIARALVARPDVLLLDEPSLGLAPTVVDIVFEALAAIRERGLTVLLVEQRAQRTVGSRRSLARARERRAAPDPHPSGRVGHPAHDCGIPLVTSASSASGLDWQTLADATALGAIYALMAVGIGLVFGVLRLVNFAYGQLVMAGCVRAGARVGLGWPAWASIALCFASVLVLSVLMDRLVFRPLRGQSPAVMLVATFAVAFLLQSVALLWFGPLGKIASSLSSLNRPVTISGVDIRKITIVAIVVAVVCLIALSLLLERTTIGLHMRAASMDFRPRGCSACAPNRVIGVAVLLSGALAAVVAVMLTVRTRSSRRTSRCATRSSCSPASCSAA